MDIYGHILYIYINIYIYIIWIAIPDPRCPALSRTQSPIPCPIPIPIPDSLRAEAWRRRGAPPEAWRRRGAPPAPRGREAGWGEWDWSGECKGRGGVAIGVVHVVFVALM